MWHIGKKFFQSCIFNKDTKIKLSSTMEREPTILRKQKYLKQTLQNGLKYWKYDY